MIVDKNLTIDLNRVQPLKVIRIHEGDVNSVRLVLKLTKDNTAVSLSNITVKYDAVIAGYLAEGDANGSISDGKVIIPVTANMTAMSGILQVDVKLVEGTSVVFTQTITLLVDKAVINDETIIDFSGTTIGQRLDNIEATLEAKADSASVYTKGEVDSKLAGKQNHAYRNITDLSDCDNMTDPGTIYRFYYGGTYHWLICTSPTGAQYRFQKNGEVYFREYNTTTNVWGNWTSIHTKIPSGTITGGMINDYTIPYSKLSDDYTFYFNAIDLDDVDNCLYPGVYTGDATQTWMDNYDVYGDFVMIGDFSRQILIFPSDNKVFTRYHTKTAYVDRWSEWQLITPALPDSSVTYEKLSEDYIRFYAESNIENCNNFLNYAIYSGTASGWWSTNFGVSGRYTMIADFYSQFVFFADEGRIFYRKHVKQFSSDYWTAWNEIRYYNKDEADTLLAGKADIEYGFVGENYAWYTDPSQGLSLTGSYSLIGNYCHLSGQAPLMQGWERIYYSLPVACIDSGATIALNGNNNFSVATGQINNTSVLEIKQMGSSSMPSGTVRFTLIYRYK